MQKFKTLDVNARSWFDRINGNSYFSAYITLDYGLETQRKYFLPFQYGYGEQYQYETLNELKRNNEVPDNIGALWQLRDEGVIIRTNKINALKRELKKENY
jgi:hypothetical protein